MILEETSLSEQLESAINSGQVGLWVRSYEPEEVLMTLYKLTEEYKDFWDLRVWDCIQGALPPEKQYVRPSQVKPVQQAASSKLEAALNQGANSGINVSVKPGILAVEALRDSALERQEAFEAARDIHGNINEANIPAPLRNKVILVMQNGHREISPNAMQVKNEVLTSIMLTLHQAKGNNAHLIILSPPGTEIPPELQEMIWVFDHELPSYAEREEIISQTCRDNSAEIHDDAKLDGVVKITGGLTRLQVENVTARSIQKHGEVRDSFIWNLKAAAINKNGLLRLHRGDEKFDSYMKKVGKKKEVFVPGLGGLAGIKTFCSELLHNSAEMTLAQPRGVLLLGVPGCVADDTRLYYLRGKRKSAGGRSLAIRDFYQKFNGLAQSGGRLGAAWDPYLDTYLQSFDAETGKVFYNKVKGVYPMGEKECVTIVTDVSGSVTLTLDHPVLAQNGTFKPAGEVVPGELLRVRGSMLPVTKEQTLTAVARPRVTVEGLKYYPCGWPHTVEDQTSGKVYEYRRTHRARLIVEARMNGLDYDEFVRILKNDVELAETLVFLSEGLEVHHLDEDPQNDEAGNLVVMTKAEHTQLHCDESRFNVEYTKFAVVVRVDDAGLRQTYDVSMELPHGNFTVNDGIIVHNTGKSAFAKALGNETGRPTLILDVGALMGSFVGQTEAATRQMLRIADAMAPCILFVDELEKAIGGKGGEQDGGVNSRLKGALLTWLNDHESDVFFMATANDISMLPPEFTRAERFDGIFFMDLPTVEQRNVIWDIYLKAFKLDETQPRPADGKWTGAEIKSCCRLAYLLKKTLIQAANYVIPVTRTWGPKINKLREWADKNCVDAETGKEFHVTSLQEREMASADGPLMPQLKSPERRSSRVTRRTKGE